MTIGRVLGCVALERGLSGARELRWIQVCCGDVCLTALDPLGAEKGQLVLIAGGERAGHISPEVPADAVVVGVLAQNGISG